MPSPAAQDTYARARNTPPRTQRPPSATGAAVVAVISGAALGCSFLYPATPGPGPTGRQGKTVCVNADGPAGRDTYELIESVLGPGSIESPDNNHSPPERHIFEEVDPVVGPHFVFAVHRDVDLDRMNTDRQRMEIKVYDKSDPRLRATDGATFTYRWRFKLATDLAVSHRFTHLFQLKGVGGDDQKPLVTLTAASRRTAGERLELRHMVGDILHVLADVPLAEVRDRWLEATCQVTFGHQGALAMRISTLDGTDLLSVDQPAIDLWRDGSFVRPKWGIYRSLEDPSSLNAEERVRFANFAITGDGAPDSTCINPA